jgi:hypothetical protein
MLPSKYSYSPVSFTCDTCDQTYYFPWFVSVPAKLSIYLIAAAPSLVLYSAGILGPRGAPSVLVGIVFVVCIPFAAALISRTLSLLKPRGDGR